MTNPHGAKYSSTAFRPLKAAKLETGECPANIAAATSGPIHTAFLVFKVDNAGRTKNVSLIARNSGLPLIL